MSLLAFSALFISACATPISSTIEAAHDANIGGYETYAWINAEPYIGDDESRSALINPLNYQRLRTEIDAQLAHKGYVRSSASDADFVLGVTLGSRDRVRVQQYYSNFGYQYFGYSRFNRFGSYGSSYIPYSTTTSIRTITEGSVAVDVFDNQSHQAIWHGLATKSLTGDSSGQYLIAEAVDALIGAIPERPEVAANASTVGETHSASM